MAYCPNCNAAIAREAQDCDVCGTSFGADTWLPLDALPQAGSRFTIARLIFKLGLTAVVLPLAGLVLGMLITAIVPGCQCDEVFGCHGCGLDALTAFLLYEGYEGSLLAVVFVFPAAAMLSGLLTFVAKRNA